MMRKKLFRFLLVFSVLSAVSACSMIHTPAQAAPTNKPSAHLAAASAPAPSEPQAEAAAASQAAPVSASAPAAADDDDYRPVPSVLKPSEELRNIWDNIRRNDDVTVLPEVAPPPPVVETTDKPAKPVEKEKPKKDKTKDKTEKASGNADKNSKTKVNVQLRKPPATPPRSKGKGKSTPPAAPSVKMPPAKTAPPPPTLTRRQILEREINRERSALKAAQSQLSSARKKGNTHQVNRLMGIIKDRELNIKAISKEMVK